MTNNPLTTSDPQPTMPFTPQDAHWMSLALRLAEQGLYSTSPNPRVGCVIVKNEVQIGSGWHQRAGEPHAEVYALREAGAAAENATAYVTLEPCSHTGRTPPCADALIAAGVARVVIAMQDPNPLVSGKGIAKLRAAGIAVASGLMEASAQELNRGFVSRMTNGMPWVRSKIGMSLDGRTALANGVSQWITSPEARQDVQHWRARSCAVLTGINTILTDDAQLNVRSIEVIRQPLRVVLDSQLRIPLTAKLLESQGVLIYTTRNDIDKITALEKLGAVVCVLSGEQFDLNVMLRDLAQHGCNEVLVEAGSTLNGALLKAGCVDELILYLAPQLLGDVARGMAQLGELTRLDQRINLHWQEVRQVGKDLRLVARVLRAE
ncbi:MAG: bifunctional diaminohydroxyphosphoribosylaminopyrimidine deaminase/5-amino-6-(5-phosphoribosylamino)uracil reductase RibD [Gallionella sp.]|nr:bifunctional diaminohydroxyphosphoribosylaminopyrimidine deaminase/5-amino-6-(5-phosphoribosylamino)uracil reductase RibD [Gallionella sp.]MDD4959212.1 bifunctional diaminohydroxyphosphoribosylaminopyrimidine deaminase/5-amino-6-(5-phosphoribosylamino)uracil reductase RibD [Gallionella sp.]